MQDNKLKTPACMLIIHFCIFRKEWQVCCEVRVRTRQVQLNIYSTVMFAAGHILKTRPTALFKSAIPKSLLVTPTKQSSVKSKCFVPCIWQLLPSTIIGLLVILLGAFFCYLGYRFDSRHNGDTYDESSVDYRSTEVGLSMIFVYLGPVLLSMGCFVCLFSYVVVCETRDAVLLAMNDKEANGNSGVKVNFIDLFLKRGYEREEERLDIVIARAPSLYLIDDELRKTVLKSPSMRVICVGLNDQSVTCDNADLIRESDEMLCGHESGLLLNTSIQSDLVIMHNKPNYGL